MAKGVLGVGRRRMPQSETRLPSIRDGETIHVESHLPPNEVVGTVLLLHGLGDHVRRHRETIRLLNRLNLEVLAFDWPGCGKSSGIRGDLPTIQEAGILVERVCDHFERNPSGVIGHSTGGFFLPRLLPLELPRLRNIEWIWLSSPLINPRHGQNRLKIALAEKLAKRFPNLTLSTGVKPRDCYHPAPGESPNHFSEGVHSRISLRFGAHLLEEASRIPSLPPNLPILLTQGSEDEVCATEVALKFFAALDSKDSTLLLAAGARHEPFREPHHAGITNGLRSWLRQKIRIS
ncbi:MAG: alpha/beta fold hydrolase [Verrucomicrobiota bacterium]